MTNVQLLVRSVLQNASGLEWSIQGFGMLRTYLSKEVRLHIWHSAFRVPGVSDIHDHPWDFESEVVCGELTNHPYTLLDPPFSAPDARDFTMSTIRCGPGAAILGSARKRLAPRKPHRFISGNVYSQNSFDIHDTKAIDGTVTIVRRTFKADTEHARVFFPLGAEWVSAEPRKATTDEVRVFVDAALARLQ